LHGAAFRRRAGTGHKPCSLARASLPIWSCSVWGLPCLRHYCRSGALLPHLFTLTIAWSRLLDQVPRYPRMPFQKAAPCNGGMFSVALAVHGPLRPRPGRYPAHCPLEFGLSSPGNPRPPWRTRISGSDRPVLLPVDSLPRNCLRSPPARSSGALNAHRYNQMKR